MTKLKQSHMKKHILIVLMLSTQTRVRASGSRAESARIIEKQLVYKSIDGVPLQVDLFLPEHEEQVKPRPAIAFFHGGGWAYGGPSGFHEAGGRYARLGYVTASFQYRLSTNEDGSYPLPGITPV